MEIAGEMEVDLLHRQDLGIAAAGGASFMPNDGPSEGSRRHSIAFLPMWLSASAVPTVVVVLPSPAGVGVMAVTRMSLPLGLLLSDLM